MSLRFFSNFIIKKPINFCVNCLHYMEYNFLCPQDELYSNKTTIGKCSLFGKQHLVTGEIVYDDALECRINNSKCGKNGQFYLQKDKDIIK